VIREIRMRLAKNIFRTVIRVIREIRVLKNKRNFTGQQYKKMGLSIYMQHQRTTPMWVVR
jgi:hypothetical protein